MTRITAIYMPLPNEGVEVWRPISAEQLSNDTFRVMGPMPADEDWEFRPESLVTVAFRRFADGKSGYVAMAETTRAP